MDFFTAYATPKLIIVSNSFIITVLQLDNILNRSEI
jgi:hypothetical protein